MIGSKRKGGALYRRVSELLLSPKEGWRRIKWNLYAKVQRPEKWASSWEEGLSSLQEGDWAVAESQRGMTQDEVKIVCQGATPWKTGIFLRRRVKLFSGGWVSCCWVPRRDDVGDERNDCKTDKENRKGKYKHLHILLIKCLILKKKERKKEVSYFFLFPLLGRFTL